MLGAVEPWVTELLIYIGGFTAALAAYAKLKELSPRAARFVISPITWLWIMPKKIWRKLWSDEHGNLNGPSHRILVRLRRMMAEEIHFVTDPKFDELNARGTRQHDEQNELTQAGFRAMDTKLDQMGTSMTTQFSAVETRFDGMDERLDRGSIQLASHDAAITSLFAGQRNPDTRQRSTDPENNPPMTGDNS